MKKGITSKQMYRLARRLEATGDFKLWLADIQIALGLKWLAEKNANMAGNLFWHSKRCKHAGDDLVKVGL